MPRKTKSTIRSEDEVQPADTRDDLPRVREADEVEDDELIRRALDMYSNWLETGNILLSTSDWIAQHQTKSALERIQRMPLKALTNEQQRLVIRIRHLRDKHSTL